MRPKTAHWKDKIKENISKEVSLADLVIYWVKNQVEDQATNFFKQNQFSEFYFLHFHLSNPLLDADPFVNNILGQLNHPMHQ